MSVREYVNVAVPRIAEYEAQGFEVVGHVAKGEDWEAVLMMREVCEPSEVPGARVVVLEVSQ